MKVRQAYLIITYVIMGLFIILLSFYFKNNFNLVIWLSIILVIGTIIFFKIQRGSFLQVAIIFVLLTYLFHFGQSLIITLGFDDIYMHRNILSTTTYDLYINSELFCICVIYFIGFGYLFAGRKLENKETVLHFKDRDLKRIRKISYYVILVCIIPMIYIDITKIYALINGGYLDTYSVYSSGIARFLYTLGQFARIGVLLLLFGLQKDQKKANRLLFISSIYYVLMMLSGDRGTNMIYIISNYLIYFKYVRSLKLKYLMLSLIIIYFLAGFLSAISLFRYSEFSLSSFINVFSMRSKDGIIYSCLREFGVTLGSLVYSLEYIPTYNNFNLGGTYLSGILAIFPKLPDFLAIQLDNSFTFIHAFPQSVSSQLGGSFVAELYFNFGWVGCIFSTLIGLFIGKIEYIMKKSNNVKYIGIIIALLPSLFLWVRDFYCNLFFKTFWIGLLIYFVKVKVNEKNTNYYK